MNIISVLTNYSENILKLYEKHDGTKHLRYRYQKWFMENSVSFTEVDDALSQITSIKRDSRLKACYNNCFLAMSDGDYYEGFILTCGIPLEHSWLVVDGKVVDPTLAINGQRMIKQMKAMSEFEPRDRNLAKEKRRYGVEYYGLHIPSNHLFPLAEKSLKTGPFLFDYFLRIQ